MKRLIGELGLRFRPTAQADLEAHAALLALLARDLADVNPDHLETAIAEHVRCSRFMPKAAELLEIIRKQHPKASSHDDLQRLADMGNAKCTRPDLHWVVRGTEIKLEPWDQPVSTTPRNLMDRRGERMTGYECAALNQQLEEAGATARYREDGSRYVIDETLDTAP